MVTKVGDILLFLLLSFFFFLKIFTFKTMSLDSNQTNNIFRYGEKIISKGRSKKKEVKIERNRNKHISVYITHYYLFLFGSLAPCNGSEEEATAATEAEAKQPKIQFNSLHLRCSSFFLRSKAQYLRRKRDSSPSSPTELRPLHSIGHSRR